MKSTLDSKLPELLGMTFPASVGGLQSNDSSETGLMSPANSTSPRDVYIHWLCLTVIPVVCILGVLANTCVVVVMARHGGLMSRINILLTGLAIFDSGLLTASGILFPTSAMAKNTTQKLPYIIYPISLTCQVASVWTCVTVSIDRYIVICHALLVKGRWTTRRAKKVLLLIVLASASYSFPTAFHSHKSVNGSVWYREIYGSYMYLVFLLILPAGAMIILNTLCIRHIRTTARQRQSITAYSEDSLTEARKRVTIIVVAIVSTFLIFNFPIMVVRFLRAFGGKSFEQWLKWQKDRFFLAQMIANILVLVNSATNFVIYCALSSKFRRIFVETFLPCCETRPDTSLLILQSSATVKTKSHPSNLCDDVD